MKQNFLLTYLIHLGYLSRTTEQTIYECTTHHQAFQEKDKVGLFIQHSCLLRTHVSHHITPHFSTTKSKSFTRVGKAWCLGKYRRYFASSGMVEVVLPQHGLLRPTYHTCCWIAQRYGVPEPGTRTHIYTVLIVLTSLPHVSRLVSMSSSFCGGTSGFLFVLATE